jgi:3-oxoacyl-[acyl-carrier-protein] synthase II
MKSGRIAVTGVGMVTALGQSATSTFDRLVRGDRAFSDVTLFDTAGQRTRHAAEIPGFRVGDVVPRGESGRWSRSDALALAAARDALTSASGRDGALSGPLGIAVGVTTGGMLEAEELFLTLGGAHVPAGSAARLLSYPLSSTASRLMEELTASGPVATLCSACSSGANALVQGAAWLRLGVVGRVIAGGTDALCHLTFTGFNALGATDFVPCRPFDRHRGGLTLGEGAAFVVLETEAAAGERGARVLAWLSGFGVGAEAHHITQPDPSARVPKESIRAALARAHLSAADIDYVNAHGTGTTLNDAVETIALRAALGREADRVLVSSAKGQIGHTLGAAGAIEAAITVLSLARQEVPPTAGLTEPDDACRLNHVLGVGRRAPLRAALSTSFGFGGTGTVLVFEREDAPRRAAPATGRTSIAVTAVSTIGSRGIMSGVACAGYADPLGPSASEPLLSLSLPSSPLDLLSPARSRRFDRAACLVTVGVEAALAAAGTTSKAADPREGIGLVVGTAFGNVERIAAFVRAAIDKGPRRAPPAEFPHLLPSASAGNASIYLGLSGPVLATSDLEATAESAVSLACDWLEMGLAPCLVAGSADPHDAFVARVLGPACERETGHPRSEGSAWLVLEPELLARERGAPLYALVRRRYEFSLGAIENAQVEPPADPDRALVVSSRDTGVIRSLLERSGWKAVARRSTAPATGFHEGAGGFALAASAALIARGDTEEVLVCGWSATHVFVFHLVRAP